MKSNTLGKIGEKAVKNYLRLRFYTILKCNYHSKYGEIDIIAKRFGYLAFVEVKTRSENSFGEPSEYVDKLKQQKIIKTAYSYVFHHPHNLTYRFDVAEVRNVKGKLKINYIKNAFIEE